MAVDHLEVIRSAGARVLGAYHHDPDGRVPWSDRWTVRSVARHVAGSHHAVALILSDRPDADFARAAALPRVEADDPAFPGWFAGNTERLLEQCRAVPPDAACWSPHPLLSGTAAYWVRRIAHDSLVHQWDAEAGAGAPGPPIEPLVAADAVDELLHVGLPATRSITQAPAGPVIRLECTDADSSWTVDLREIGRLTLRTEPVDAALTVRGPAAALLLWLWGRLDLADAGLSAEGDRSVLTRRTELLPTA